MGIFSKQPLNATDTDVARENYKGPSAIAAAAGEGFIAHFVWAAAGLVGGGLATWAGYTHINPRIEEWRRYGSKLIETSDSTFVRGWGRLINAVLGHGPERRACADAEALCDKAMAQYEHGFGLWLTNHTVGLIPPVKRYLKEKTDHRLSIAVTGGGILAFVGYVIVPIILSFFGAKKGAEGKNQFNRAKSEIWTLRQRNAELEKQNIELEGRRDTAQGRYGDTLVEAQALPESPVSIEEPKIEPPKPAAPPVQKADIQRETPTEIEPPKVEEPEIKGPKIGPEDGWDRTAAPAVKQGGAPSVKVAHASHEAAMAAEPAAEAARSS